MDESRQHWEARYQNSAGPLGSPSPFIAAHAHLAVGRALDIAGGSGRNALFLARRGLRVLIIDIAFAALQKALHCARPEGLPVAAVQADLDDYPLPEQRFDTLINVRYLQRSLFAPMRRALKPGGALLYETFLIGQQRIGHPRNPSFLLAPDELRAAFADFEILHYREGLLDGNPPAYLAQLVARRPYGIEF